MEAVNRLLDRISAQGVIAAKTMGADVEVTPEVVNLATEGAAITELASGEPWRSGVRVIAGAVIEYAGVTYKCIQGHVTQNDWKPGTTTASLWDVVQSEPEEGELLPWVAGEAVKIGDKRTYGGVTYECIQAHTTQAGWTPPAVANLWKKVLSIVPFISGCNMKDVSGKNTKEKSDKCIQNREDIYIQ